MKKWEWRLEYNQHMKSKKYKRTRDIQIQGISEYRWIILSYSKENAYIKYQRNTCGQQLFYLCQVEVFGRSNFISLEMIDLFSSTENVHFRSFVNVIDSICLHRTKIWSTSCSLKEIRLQIILTKEIEQRVNLNISAINDNV